MKFACGEDVRKVTVSMVRRCGPLFVFVVCLVAPSPAQTIELDTMEREAWMPVQTIRGEASGIEGGILTVGTREYDFDVEGGVFAIDVHLREGTNAIVACGGGICSDTARWTLGYEVRPEIYAYAEVSGREVELHASIVEAPAGPVESYSWSADADNPTSVSLSNAADSIAVASIPDSAPIGEYYFDLVVVDSMGNEGTGRTLVTVTGEGIAPFDIRHEHASWIDAAMVYEVTPYIFERNGKWRDVTARLGEISAIGVNTLWIQPVFDAQMEGPNTAGQGYGIVDYFELREDLGTEEDLRELVRSAKDDYGIRVLFDFVPSHTSIRHPYAQDVRARGEASPYYSFYMTEPDDAPYSQHYHTDVEPFVYYFWEDLVILNWDNPEVYQMMREAGQKWIEEFDIDGYRIDAVWGVNARTPDAMQKWRFDLKRIKPEIFLLGEAPAARSLNFDGRFDAAYDWFAELDWVSHWTWQTNYSATANHTIFNSPPEGARSDRLRAALSNRGEGWHPDAKVFRFLQNNDTFPFIDAHGLQRTKMASSLLFALPGIPMIYNGQETGHDRHPYQTSQIFQGGETIRQQDPYGLYDHYRDLAAVRRAFPVLRTDTFEELTLAPSNIQGHTFAFRRWDGNRHALAIINMGQEPVRARIDLPLSAMGIGENDTYYLTDVMSGDPRTLSGGALRYPVVSVDSFETRIFILADQVVETPTFLEQHTDAVPERVSLVQNYPNPFNRSTTISFDLPETRSVTLRVFDVLGREVARLVDGPMMAGKHALSFDGRGLSSGLYFYRLDAGAQSLTRQMLLTK